MICWPDIGGGGLEMLGRDTDGGVFIIVGSTCVMVAEIADVRARFALGGGLGEFARGFD